MKIKIMRKLLTICFLVAATFIVNAQDIKTYYYFAYGTETGMTKKVYTTPLQTVTINEKTHFGITDASAANQFRDYMEAEYSNLNGRFFPDGNVFFTGHFDEATATSYYRSTLKLYDSSVKELYFKYLPEKK